jgi:SAM-dependent methyltransferase
MPHRLFRIVKSDYIASRTPGQCARLMFCNRLLEIFIRTEPAASLFVFQDMFLRIAACLLAAQAAQAQAPAQEKNPHEGQEKIDPARVYTYQKQELELPDFSAEGWILDIGGGGEGVIGRLKGSQVVAIDLYSWGMKRTPPGPLKLVMDATDLKFLDESFGTVTSFFTLMYMSPEQQNKAMREAYRTLKHGGRMRIWDVQLPAPPDPKKDIALYPFVFRLPGETVETGYGTSFPKEAMDLPYYLKMAEAAGFNVESRRVAGNTFELVLRKN